MDGRQCLSSVETDPLCRDISRSMASFHWPALASLSSTESGKVLALHLRTTVSSCSTTTSCLRYLVDVAMATICDSNVNRELAQHLSNSSYYIVRSILWEGCKIDMQVFTCSQYVL